MAARVILQPPDQPVTVRADKLLLKRVLANLVENGIHAGEEAGTAGEVVIGWTADPGHGVVTITVDDHGKGVADASRDKIFEPYVTTKAAGTGLRPGDRAQDRARARRRSRPRCRTARPPAAHASWSPCRCGAPKRRSREPRPRATP